MGSSSFDTAPVTGSLLFNAPVCRLAVYCTAGFSSWVLFGGCDCIRLAVFRLFLQRVIGDFVTATDSDAPAGARSGITFGVTLEVPWNTPEAYMHLHTDGVVDLDTVPDVLGLAGLAAGSGCSPGSTREGCSECTHINSGSKGPEKGIS